MRLSFFSALVLALALSLAPSAHADEIGGSGFEVPQSEWLWGVDGLVRTPVDLSADFGVAFFGHAMRGKIIYDDRFELGPAGSATRTGTLNFNPEAIEGGFRMAGGIGYWSCCILIEPAMAFRANRPSVTTAPTPRPPCATRTAGSTLPSPRRRSSTAGTCSSGPR